MPRTSSVPLTKTFHVYYSKLKRSIITTVHPTFPTTKRYHCRNSPSGGCATSEDFASDTETNVPPDFTTVFASHRFFFTSPGRSNSIAEAKCSIIQEESEDTTSLVINNGGATPIQTYSLDPFIDFRRSMQEMVEASTVNVRGDHNGDYLHELLLCYLALNTKNTHRIIVDAFIDLLVSLVMTSSPRASAIDRCRVSIEVDHGSPSE